MSTFEPLTLEEERAFYRWKDGLKDYVGTVAAWREIATLTAERDKLLPIKWPECDCSGADLNGHHADYCAVFLNPARDQCLTCGNRMAHNPHPDAGKMFAVLEFGTEWFCIPCWLRTSRATLARSWKYERETEEAKAERDALRTALEFYADPWTWNRAQPDEESRVWIPDLYGELEFGERAREALGGKS